MKADRKYTDRDVREMVDAHEYVTEYLERYQGEFDFLVDCKMRLASGVGLSTGMMRGVLNCMRVDPRVKSQLPEPVADEDGQVLHLKPVRAKAKRGHSECDITEPHESHDVPKGEYEWKGYCSGIYLINRDYNIFTKARVNAPLMMAQSPTSMIHKVADGWVHSFMWWTNQHAWGFNEMFEPDLIVRPICKYPRSIRNPILFYWSDLKDALENQHEARTECPRCFDR